jgi:hypothetical protein
VRVVDPDRNWLVAGHGSFGMSLDEAEEYLGGL